MLLLRARDLLFSIFTSRADALSTLPCADPMTRGTRKLLVPRAGECRSAEAAVSARVICGGGLAPDPRAVRGAWDRTAPGASAGVADGVRGAIVWVWN
jgi:hypothetical protein